MFCSKCGKEMPDGAEFCGGCGAPARDRSSEGLSEGDSTPAASGAEADAPSVASTVDASSQSSSKARLNPKIIAAIVAAVAVIAAIVLVVNISSKSGTSIKNSIDVVELLTCDSDEAYEILNSKTNVSPSDFTDVTSEDYDYDYENAPVYFISSSELADSIEASYTDQASGTNEEYVSLLEKVYSKPQYMCSFGASNNAGYYNLSRANFDKDSMLYELTQADLTLVIPDDVELDCESIANYLQPFVPYEQCYVVQEDSDHFSGGVKGGGCVAEFSVSLDSDSYTEMKYWAIDADVYSISRDSYGSDYSSSFDVAYNSISTANYIDSYKV